MRFDPRKPHGIHSPPWQPPGCDRPALYEQDGNQFDSGGDVIIPGVRAAAPAPDAPPPESERVYTPAELVAGADTIPWSLFMKEAKRILGPTCPGGKAQIVGALEAALGKFEEKQAKKATGKRQPTATPDKPSPAEPEEAVAEAKAPEPPATGACDLAAWVRGQKKYRFAEVRKAIRSKHNVQIQGPNETWDAVLLLVKEKYCTLKEVSPEFKPAAAVE